MNKIVLWQLKLCCLYKEEYLEVVSRMLSSFNVRYLYEVEKDSLFVVKIAFFFGNSLIDFFFFNVLKQKKFTEKKCRLLWSCEMKWEIDVATEAAETMLISMAKSKPGQASKNEKKMNL